MVTEVLLYDDILGDIGKHSLDTSLDVKWNVKLNVEVFIFILCCLSIIVKHIKHGYPTYNVSNLYKL